MTGAGLAISAARMPGMARMGSVLMNGFEGQITCPQIGICDYGENVVLRPRFTCSVENESCDPRIALLEITLEIEDAVFGHDSRPHTVVGHWKQPGRDSERTGEPRGDFRQTLTFAQQSCSLDMDRQIAVAEPEPSLATQLAKSSHEGPGLVAASPAHLLILESCQRIHQRIEVGRDMEPEMFKIVTRVRDNRQSAGGQDASEARSELCSANASGQG